MTNQPRLKAWRFLAFGVVVGLRALGLLIGMALPHLPRVMEAVGRLAANERDRVGQYLTIPVPPPSTADSATTVRRDIRWLALQATAGILVGLLPVASVTGMAQNVVIAAFWPFIPDVASTLDMPVHSPRQPAAQRLSGAVDVDSSNAITRTGCLMAWTPALERPQ